MLPKELGALLSSVNFVEAGLSQISFLGKPYPKFDLVVKTRLWRGMHNLQGYSSVSQHAPTSAARRSAFLRRRLKSPARKLQWKCHLQPRPNRPLLRSMLQRRSEAGPVGYKPPASKTASHGYRRHLFLRRLPLHATRCCVPQKTRCCVLTCQLRCLVPMT